MQRCPGAANALSMLCGPRGRRWSSVPSRHGDRARGGLPPALGASLDTSLDIEEENMTVVRSGAPHIDLAPRSDEAPRLFGTDEKEFEFLHLPAELRDEIVSYVPPRDFRSVATLNGQFRETVTTHTRFSVVYGQSLAAERTARQLEEKDHPGTRDQLFGRALSAQQAGQPVKSDGALNPDDPFFDLAILHLAPHAPYFLPHPDSIPDHLSDHGVAPPIASSDFDKVVQNVLDSPTDDWARERNLNALRIRLPELELSNEREAAISAAYEAYQNHPPRPLHRKPNLTVGS
jgi:hypothetical protein